MQGCVLENMYVGEMMVQDIVGSVVVLIGLGLILYRYVIRYHAVPIELTFVEPYIIWEAIRGWGFYRYKCQYIYNGELIDANAIEVGIYSFSCPSKQTANGVGVRSKSGLISCNHIYSTEKLGLLLIISGIGIILGKVHF